MKTMKTLLMSLPKPYNDQALKNATGDLKERLESQRRALIRAFVWDDSPEGNDYWSNLYDTLK